ncbi:MAG: ATP-binding protein, partial [Aquisalinus sp.]|nr:ATP-binding protein [Aquisalinus sp.]
NGKAIWKSLQNYLPIFALFQSDRPSTDQDPEVQNPMKVAVEQALSQMEADLDAVTAQIQASAQATADRTLVKLKETYPELASVLTPKFKKPPWKNIFKLDLEADDGIPLNKRGSGVRRLVLLSFFQAEAQKRKDEAVVGGALARRVVYAIEEPETSQHPDNQIRIIEALKELAESGSQVILTTHVPGLAKLLPVDCIRHVTTDETTGDTSIEYGEEGVYEHVADALGVLPSPISSSEISLAILLEGKNDIDALKSLIKILVDAGNIDPLEDNKIFWVIGGGDNTLQDWIERKYLDKLNVHQIAIQDSDRSASAVPLSPEKTQWLHNMGQLANLTAFVTRKRNMDNYVHIAAVTRATGGQITFPAGTDEDFVRMPNVLSQQISTIGSQNLQFAATDLEGTPIQGYSASKCKRIIASFIIPQMTANEVLQRGEYFEGGETKNEILEWIEEIRTRTS